MLGKPTGSTVTILNVDDTEADRSFITRVLRHAGFQVREGASGQEALSLAVEQPDLILLDLHLPDLDGFEVCRQLKRNPVTCHIPVLLISAAFTKRPEHVRGLEGDADACLLSPLDPAELLATTHALLRSRQTADRVAYLQDAERAFEQRQQVEARLRFLVDHVAEGILTIDAQGSLQTLNSAAERLFGYSAAEVTGENIKLLIPEPQPTNSVDSLASYLGTDPTGVEGKGRAVQGQRKGGVLFPVELTVGEFQLGEQRHFSALVRDVTDLRHLEEELRQRAEDLVQTDRRKDDFLATLAHELRNPLAPLRNALHLLKNLARQGAAPVLSQSCDIMERQIQTLVRLVDDLLDVSRISRGKLQLRKEPVEVATLVARALETARPLIEAQEHELHAGVPASLWLEADPTRLAQVLANLLHNAAKYSEQAGTIWLSAAREGDHVVLRVRDTGIGIEPELLPHIFDAFVQADRSLGRSRGGLGIGLTLVRSLVEMHGGSVEAHSAGPDQGSEFIVRLPALVEPPRRPDTGPESRGADPLSGTRTVRRVLLVEDDRDTAESLAMLARLWGHEVHLAHDGPHALQLARTIQPQVVLLDIGLPGDMDGYVVVRELRQQPALEKTVFVAMTGYGTEEDRRRSREAGFQHHLTKPAPPDVLRQLLASLDLPAP